MGAWVLVGVVGGWGYLSGGGVGGWGAVFSDREIHYEFM